MRKIRTSGFAADRNVCATLLSIMSLTHMFQNGTHALSPKSGVARNTACRRTPNQSQPLRLRASAGEGLGMWEKF
jgi:hypothetical protein